MKNIISVLLWLSLVISNKVFAQFFPEITCSGKTTSAIDFSKKVINRCNSVWTRPSRLYNENTLVAIGPRVAIITKHVLSPWEVPRIDDEVKEYANTSYFENTKFYSSASKYFELATTVDGAPSGAKIREFENLPGGWDVSVIVQPAILPDFLPPYANLSTRALKKDDIVVVYTTYDVHSDVVCSNDLTRLKSKNLTLSAVTNSYSRFKVSTFTKDNIETFLNGKDMAYPVRDTQCRQYLKDHPNTPLIHPDSGVHALKDSNTRTGYSGSMYLRATPDNKAVELVGLHSKGNDYIPDHSPTAMGINLTSPEVQRWILEVAGENKICGLTMKCPQNRFKP